jgi:hypothetical protein
MPFFCHLKLYRNIFIPIGLFSQQMVINLLENGSFEDSDLKGVELYSSSNSTTSYHTKSSQDFEQRCPGWLAPWLSKPDMVDSAARQMINARTYGKALSASDGRRFIRMMVHGAWDKSMPTYRDYVVQKLKTPLKKGVTYQIDSRRNGFKRMLLKIGKGM